MELSAGRQRSCPLPFPKDAEPGEDHIFLSLLFKLCGFFCITGQKPLSKAVPRCWLRV